MFDFIVRIVIRKVILAIVALSFVSCLSDWGFGNGDVDLKKATWLVAEKVPLVVDGGSPIPGGTVTPPVPVNNLFTLKPGTKVNAQALGSAIDPTGTTILNDFDGDGILNINETTTNVWVADYPEIDTVVAPPITMKIAILKSSTGESDEIVSEINSDDLESKKNEGSESVHQSEVNLKTVQYQDQFKSDMEQSESNSIDTSFSYVSQGTPASQGQPATGPGFSTSYAASRSWSKKVALETTTTKWADKPFKNDIDREAKAVKSDSASSKARKYRNEKSSKTNETSKIESNAGYVRAALYIKNRSTNMPVRLTNILCTLMFETSRGELLPVQSFRLRNDDFSLFQVDVYGGSEFGPYVVELGNLNTVEIENAIASGYTPKIFIVDYSMTHVPDSNYKSVLLNYSGDNLKIVEENAKGRTALVKVYGPGYREKFRVAAFDDLSIANPCTTTTASQLAPGVTLKKSLERISCSGVQLEFGDYVFDLSELAPSLNESRVHLKGIKSFAGIPTTIPCDNQTWTGSDGVERTACVQKPLKSWTDEERRSSGVWAIYSKGKYNDPTEYWVDGSNIRIFDPGAVRKAQMLKGVDSIIWAGDNYDIVYISVKDMAKNEEFPPYGSTPVGSTPTGGGIDPNSPDSYFKMNTKWDLSMLGEVPYEPDVRSKFLGKIGFGEKLVLTMKLDQTKYLNPSFGTSVDMVTFDYFSDFKYTPAFATKRFNFDEVMDFEISLGFGGKRTDWVHIVRDTITNDNTRIKKLWIDTSGYTDQTFRICLRMPIDSNVVDPNNSLVTVYLRPALNSAYRRTIWPLRYTDVKKMRGELGEQANQGGTSILVSGAYGNIEPNDKIYIGSDPSAYTVLANPTIPAGAPEGTYSISIDPPLRSSYGKTSLVTIPGILFEPDVRLNVTKGFVSDWNNQVTVTPADNPDLKQSVSLIQNGVAPGCSEENQFNPFGCLGYNPDYNAINWMGSYNKGVPFWNSWTDAGSFYSFLAGGSFEIGTASGKSYRASSLASDHVLSDTSADVPYGEPVSVSNGDAMMVFWKQDTSIVGKVVKITDPQTLVLNQFTLATSVGTATELTAKLDSTSGKVTIIWENGLDIYIAIRNFADGAVVLAPTKVVTRVSGSRIGLAVGINRALVTWADIVPIPLSLESTRSVKGKIYDATNGSVTVNTFNLFTVNSWNNWGYEADADGNGGQYALVSRHWTDYSGNQSNVVNHVVNLSTGAIVNTVTLSTNSVVAINGVNVAAGTNYGLVIYKGASGTWYGRSINLTTGAAVGSSNFDIVVNPAFIRASTIGDYAYVQYSVNGALQVKVVNLALNAFQYGNALTLSSAQVGAAQRSSKVVVSSEGVLFSAWEHTDGTKKTIRGRTFTFSPWALKGSSEFFLSTKNEGPQTGLPEVGVYQTRALPVWRSEDLSTDSIRRFDLDLVNPGSLRYGLNNFFIAPLIERDYKINATIVP
ncbi:LIC12048 family lipoprotein [Leptospira sp. SA-E8]|uniref:LIC12048 family lipoprotein n=1 Tax=Leptospira sp. SA-E8 TaxID=3422259 RepID=UPI003EB719F5